jgi:hypothetical protein
MMFFLSMSFCAYAENDVSYFSIKPGMSVDGVLKVFGREDKFRVLKNADYDRMGSYIFSYYSSESYIIFNYSNGISRRGDVVDIVTTFNGEIININFNPNGFVASLDKRPKPLLRGVPGLVVEALIPIVKKSENY